MSTERPTQLGKYQLIDVLGEGAMGVVYRAFDSVLNRYLAIKVMSAAIAADQSLRERFLREARAAGSLQHPNIITIYDFGEVDAHLFIAMEFVEGEDLAAIIDRNEELPLAAKLEIVIDVLNGLSYAHSRGVVHRDIKPGNIRVSTDARAMLMDFGIAHVQKSDLTMSGDLLGTPQYMAPEQVTGGAITASTDIFAVGSVLYELLTNKKPFDGPTLHVILTNIVSTEPTPLHEVASDLPPALETILDKALAKDPAHRYERATAMARALTDVRQGIRSTGNTATISVRVPVVPDEPPMTVRTTALKSYIATEVARKQRWGIWGGLAGLIAVAAAAVFVVTGRRNEAASSGAMPPSLTPSSATGAPAAPPQPASPKPTPAPSAAPTSAAAPALKSGQLKLPARAGAPASPPPASPVSVPVSGAISPAHFDSVLDSLRASAIAARAGAVEAGATPRDLERGDSVMTAAEAHRAQKQLGNAVGDFSVAAVLMAQAGLKAHERSTVAAVTAQQASPPAAPDTSAKVAAVPNPASDPRAEIERIVTAYEHALETQDVATVRKVYPALTPQQAKAWDTFFGSVRNFDATIGIDQLKLAGNSASATLNVLYEYELRSSGQAQRQKLQLQAAFARDSTGWSLLAIH